MVLMDNLEKKYGKGPSQYLFRNSYFFIDLPPDTNEPREFVFLRHKKTVSCKRQNKTIDIKFASFRAA